jgi:hypothetical protein
MRKRGELLLLNAHEFPQRLRLTLLSGSGNSSPQRTISVILNGELLDRIHLMSAARVVTKPFVARQPWSQIELLVDEDADPGPRPWGLWNLWVPAEPRRLNIGLMEIELVSADLREIEASSHNFLAADEPAILVNGIFPDRWMASEATVTLRAHFVPDEIRIKGLIPGVPTLPFPYPLRVSVNGEALPPCVIASPGSVHLNCPIPGQIRTSIQPGALVKIELRADATFSTVRDPRKLSLRLECVELGRREQDATQDRQVRIAHSERDR